MWCFTSCFATLQMWSNSVSAAFFTSSIWWIWRACHHHYILGLHQSERRDYTSSHQLSSYCSTLCYWIISAEHYWHLLVTIKHVHLIEQCDLEIHGHTHSPQPFLQVWPSLHSFWQSLAPLVYRFSWRAFPAPCDTQEYEVSVWHVIFQQKARTQGR